MTQKNLVKRLYLFVSLIVTCWPLSACKSASEYPPDIPEGGRVVTITRAPNRPDEFLAAAETGGLFRSVNAGTKWTHLTGLPSDFIADVAYAPNDPQIIIVTFRVDFRSGVNSNYIWRSGDGGRSWSDTGLALPNDFICSQQKQAFGISFDATSSDVFVGTSCGVATSHDRGATWSLDETMTSGKQFINGINSLLALGSGDVLAVADDHIVRRSGSSGTWTALSGAAISVWSNCVHCLAQSPANPQHVFLAGAEMQESFDRGATWSALPGGNENHNREPFIVLSGRLTPGSANIATYLLYTGDGINLQHFMVAETQSGSSTISLGNVNLPHSDPSDFLFDVDGVTPKFITGDFGLAGTSDKGAHWSYWGGGPWGLDALQIIAVAGQTVGDVSNPKAKYLYFSTQDNYVWASEDDGYAWKTHICCEGPGFQLDPVISSTKTKITYVICGACSNGISAPLLKSSGYWTNAPSLTGRDTASDTPIRLTGGTYLQHVDPSSTSSDNTFRLTNDWGKTWQGGSVAVVKGALTGPPVVVEQVGTHFIFQPVAGLGVSSGSGSPVFLNEWLFPSLVQVGLGSGQIDIAMAQLTDVVQALFAVNPSDLSQILVVDRSEAAMKMSRDTGQNWTVDANLAGAMTQGGKFQLFTPPFLDSLASAIAFDPFASCHILVGARQGGIAESIDGGLSWSHISGSEVIPNVSSFYFPPSGPVTVSSYGRGLWRLSTNRSNRCVAQRQSRKATPIITTVRDPFSAAIVQTRGSLFPDNCPDCRIIVVKEGRVNVIATLGRRITRFSHELGQAFEFEPGGKEVALEVPDVDARALTVARGETLKRLAPGDQVRGMILRNGQLIGLVQSTSELPFQPQQNPSIRVIAATYLSGVAAGSEGQSLEVRGTGFAAGREVQLDIRTRSGRPFTVTISADLKGNFSHRFMVRGTPGASWIVATQQNGLQLTHSTANFIVLRHEGEERNEN